MIKHERLIQSLTLIFAKSLMQASFQRLFPNISNPHKFGHSCSILENNVLMHQCAISAKDIKINSLSHPSPVGKEVKQLEFLATKIQYSKFNVQSCLVAIICTIVQWRISATFSKGVKGGIL